MKKIILSFCAAFMVLIGLTSCKTELKDRGVTPKIDGVYQYYDGTVYITVSNLGVLDNEPFSLEYSINDGDWISGLMVYETKEQGQFIGQILYTKLDNDSILEYVSLFSNDKLAMPNETITISIRLPEINDFKASLPSEKVSYTLKEKVQSDLKNSFFSEVIDYRDYLYTSEEFDKKYVFYYMPENPMAIKIGLLSEKTDSGLGNFRYKISELTTEEYKTIEGFGLEYKVLNYDQRCIMRNVEPVYDYIDISMYRQEEDKYFYLVEGWSDTLVLNENNLWKYNSIDETEVQAFIFLVRQKGNQNSVQSKYEEFMYQVK